MAPLFFYIAGHLGALFLIIQLTMTEVLFFISEYDRFATSWGALANMHTLEQIWLACSFWTGFFFLHIGATLTPLLVYLYLCWHHRITDCLVMVCEDSDLHRIVLEGRVHIIYVPKRHQTKALERWLAGAKTEACV